MDYPKQIIEAIEQVRAKVPYLQKDATNPHFKYTYVSEGQVLGAVREAMGEAGLILVPNVVGSTVTDKGVATVDMEFRLIHKSGASWPEIIKWQGMGQDNQDKAIAKAATSGMKYFLLKFFQIETGNDPDRDAPLESNSRAKQASPKATPPQGENTSTTARTDSQNALSKSDADEYGKKMADLIKGKGSVAELIQLWEDNLESMANLPKSHRDRLSVLKSARMDELTASTEGDAV